MKRTRKWEFVAQDAKRYADLGLNPPEIARRLALRPSTVQRWMSEGKLPDTRRSATSPRRVSSTRAGVKWGKAIRSAYDLDVDDQELVKMGEALLGVAHDPLQSWPTRMSAMREFRGIVKQLNLVARVEPQELPKDEKPQPVREPRRTGTDPRSVLMAVK